jgi:hypothetical protein
MTFSGPLWNVLLATAPTLLTGSPALAFSNECFDVEIAARITRETPTVTPDCGPDCIVMSWPWIVDLDVRRVYFGDLENGPLTVLTVQHTYHGSRRGVHRWKLRRNTLGSFNVVRPEEGETLQRCPVGSPPAQSFFEPRDGTSLDDLRREGEGYFGPDPYA